MATNKITKMMVNGSIILEYFLGGKKKFEEYIRLIPFYKNETK